MYDHLPLVIFQYPDSVTNNLVNRTVRVIEMDADYVKGYEMTRDFSPFEGDSPKFKKYSLRKIGYLGVSLTQFCFRNWE